ncbi:hypothetical protein SmphiM12_472 [Sinorhizobium phage phiM12]|uniref:Uncharacterized protein n=2 Tax=Emdodecavirus TaxID=1980937 RepID=S5MDM0_9CAUD|nr:hypothetical protein AB690_gp148 [Sinorhizobium phage phiM12]YP_009212614.1 hypothetical protein AVT40_gp159 [Sinorhizobium phage phiN3]AGR48104.1 hypothetical protein SmphiM12_472 [Sinorhizobium phage phiM12]AKF13637.1 hypothetical protein PHIN3_374 [Sinorhizobium phage phiN3]
MKYKAGLTSHNLLTYANGEEDGYAEYSYGEHVASCQVDFDTGDYRFRINEYFVSQDYIDGILTGWAMSK